MSSSPTDSTDAVAPTASVPKLQTINYVNVLAYLFNFVVVFGYTKTGLPDNATLSDKYQTLVTPAPYAFAIWGIIFTSELIWTVVQCFPKYRSHELVVKGVGYNFCLASLAQCVWTFLFGLEKMVLSLVAMVSILVPLLKILAATTTQTTKATTLSEYWLLKFPFAIHASWIMAATLINVNVVAVFYNAPAAIQTTIGWGSLSILFGVGILAILGKQHRARVWVVPCVLAWASFAIGKELSSPRDKIVATFSEATIAHTKMASTVVAWLLLVAIAVELVKLRFFPSTHQVVESEDGEADAGGQYSSLN